MNRKRIRQTKKEKQQKLKSNSHINKYNQMAPKRWNTTDSKKGYVPCNSNSAASAVLSVGGSVRAAGYASSAASSSPSGVTASSTNKSTSVSQSHMLPRKTASNQTDPFSEVKRIIADNNLLSLPDVEIESMANILLTCETVDELKEWATGTLMLSNEIHRKIVRLREVNKMGVAFGGNPQSPSETGKEAANYCVAAAEELPSLVSATHIKKTGGSKTLSLVAKSSKDSGDGRKSKSRGMNRETVSLGDLNNESLIPGKFFECGCFATRHNYVANCANCGRIFCEQEVSTAAAGSYAAKAHGFSFETMECYFCGMPPDTCVSYELRIQQGLIDNITQAKNQAGLLEAQEKRDNLLRYAKEKTKRTTVIDDQIEGSLVGIDTTWMSSDEILEAEERERNRKVEDMHKHTGAYKLHLDIRNGALSLGDGDFKVEGTSQEVENANHQKDVQLYELPDQNSVDDHLVENQWGPGLGKASKVTSGSAILPVNTSREMVTYDETDDDSTDYDEAPRIAAMPGLQRIWYQEAEDERYNVNENAQDITCDKLRGKESIPRQLMTSRRVQNEYYEENQLRWAVEQQDALDAKRKIISMNQTKGKKEPMFGTSSGVEHNTRNEGGDGWVDNKSHNIVLHQLSPPPTSEQSHTPCWNSDTGMCLTLHQPWASLLVAGIKRHEGRSWPTDARGRVWIHAAGAKPHGIEAIEAHYAPFMLPGAKMPTEYPQSCLLGYVNISDCLSKEEYEERYPNPEDRQSNGDSEYIFLCETGSKVLPFPLPMDGKHKIYKLERKVWAAARKQLGEAN